MARLLEESECQIKNNSYFKCKLATWNQNNKTVQYVPKDKKFTFTLTIHCDLVSVLFEVWIFTELFFPPFLIRLPLTRLSYFLVGTHATTL